MMMLTLLRDSFSSRVALFFARFDFSKISTEPVPFVFHLGFPFLRAKLFVCRVRKKKSIIIKKAVDDDDDATSATAVPPTKVRARVRAK